MNTPYEAGAVALPLRGIRFSKLGQSRAGRQLSDLLVRQGAVQAAMPGKDQAIRVWAGSENLDVLIDDDTSSQGVHRETPAGVIMLRFTDFPRSHPRWRPTNSLLDELIHAELGLNRLNGFLEPEPLALASSYGAMWGAIYIAACLRKRDLSGRGAYIVVPLFSALITALGRSFMSLSDPALTDVLKLPHLTLQEIFECADGRYVQNHGTYPRFVDVLLDAAGRPEWKEEARKALISLPDLSAQNAWKARLAGIFMERSAMDWENAINAAGGACTVSRTHAEWVATEHARESQIIVEDRNQTAVGPGVRVFSTKSSVAAANPGSTAQKWAMKTGGDAALPLAGVRVIDFAIILAGPTCARTLAELGADVIKIDASDRPFSPYGWLDINRGKRSIIIDLKRPKGREIAMRLIATADVMVENLRAGKMAALGLGFEDVIRVQPKIVYGSLNAFDVGGPWAGRAGWEHSAQAATGMQTARAVAGVPKMVPTPVNDYGTGLLGAYGVLLGLRQASATGKAVRVAGSLSRTGSFIQTDELTAARNDANLAQPVQTRSYKCADGWVRAQVDAAHFSSQVEERLRDSSRMSCEQAALMFGPGDAVVTIERTFSELQAGRVLDDAGLRLSWEHPNWGRVHQVAAVTDSAPLTRAGWPAPDPGDHAEEILFEAGYDSSEIAELKKTGVVHERIPLFGEKP